MACSRLVFLTLVLSVVSSFAVQVPVFIWGDLSKTGIKSNPLSKVSSEDFRTLVNDELSNNPFTVIFIEKSLSVEDFSSKNDGDTVFPYLHANIGDAVYLPVVDNALHVLNKLAGPEKVDHVKLTENGLSADIEDKSGNILFIHLNDATEGESRADLLRRHNDFMEEMFTKLQERYDSVVAVYTAHFPSWIIPETHLRVRRQAESNETGLVLTPHDYTLDGLRLYTEGIWLGESGRIVALDSITGSSTSFSNDSVVMNTTLQFTEASLTLNFKMSRGYWFFESVSVSKDSANLNLPSTDEVYAIDGFSYRCGERTTFSSTNETEFNVTFVDLKVQPFFATLNESQMEFGDSFNCVGFFSAPIWAGLFVVFILLSITFYGIMMMLDIRTMDRFDDPKGKTITINAGE